MTLERKISWQSYHIDDMRRDERDEILDGIDVDELDEEDQGIYEEIESMPVVMETPGGTFLRDDSMNPIRQIEHRICHTNFTITNKEATIVNFIEGVETLSIISRYQMLIGFGRMFKGEDVRKEISDTLINIEDYPENLLKRQYSILGVDTGE